MKRTMTNYERVAYRFTPALRARVSAVMHDKLGMSQQDIAKAFGTTQAAISKYLNGKHGLEIKEVGKTLDAEEIQIIAASMASGNSAEAQKHTCRVCQTYKKFECNLMIK